MSERGAAVLVYGTAAGIGKSALLAALRERAESFGSLGGAILDEQHMYTAPAQLRHNEWAVSGNWTIGPGAPVLSSANGQIIHRFHARDAHLVMGPATPGTPVRFRVSIDGLAPGAAHGSDVDEQGNGTVREPQLYQLIRQPVPLIDRQFEIAFLDAGVAAFAFTFG